jgi:hypothetical protein
VSVLHSLFWGPEMSRVIEWARGNGIDLNQSPSKFARELDGRFGMEGSGGMRINDAARRWLDAIDSRSGIGR